MSCERYRRDLSDKLDGALSPRRRSRLRRHLETCAACRAHEAGLQRLQRRVPLGGTPAFTPERGEQSLARLRQRLEQERPGSVRISTSRRRRRWAWGSAGVTFATAALLAWVFVLRPLPKAEIYLLSEPDAWSGISLQVAENPELEPAWDDLLQSSIAESLKAGEEGILSNPFDNPLLPEGLSDEELKALVENKSIDAPR